MPDRRAPCALPDPRDVPEADVLFTTRPESFGDVRRDLVERLRGDGRSGDADAVGRLRRPSRGAWAVNRLAREDPEGIAGLLRLDEAVRQAQDRAIAQGDGRELRARAVERHRAVATLAHRAVRLLDAEGLTGDSHLGAVEQLLEATAVDPVLADQVGRGTLDGASATTTSTLPFLVSPEAVTPATPPGHGGRRRIRGEELEQARTEVDRARLTLREVSETLRAAEQVAEDAERAAEDARRAYEQAKAAARRADHEVRRRRRDVDQARTAVRRATDTVTRLETLEESGAPSGSA